MRKLPIVGAAVAACTLAVGSAEATVRTIYIGTGTTPTTKESGPPPTLTYATSTLAVTAMDVFGTDLTGQSSVTFSHTGTETVWVSETGLSLKAPVDFTVSLSDLYQLKGSQTITETAFFDQADAAYGTTTSLGSWTFTKTNFGTNKYFTPQVTNTNPFSITEEFVLYNPSGSNSLAGQIGLQMVPNGGQPMIPESSTWAMMGLGFAGVSMLGFIRRRKSERYAF